MMKLIVTISSENVGGIISVGQIISMWRITTYLKIVSQQSNMIVAQTNISDFFFYLGFVPRAFTNHGTAGEGTGGEHSINSSLPLLSTSRALRHWPGNCYRELTFAHSLHPDLNRETLVSKRKLLTTKLHALLFLDLFAFMLRSHK